MGEDSPWISLKALVKSIPYGTVRSITTLQSWIPRDLRESTKVSLKTTVISRGQPQRNAPFESRFGSFTLVFECSFDRYDPLASVSRNPELLLPRLIYRGPGSFDWNPTYTLFYDVLVEISLITERIPFSPSLRLYPTMMFECHTLDDDTVLSRSCRRPNPVRGKLILDSVFDHEGRMRVTANRTDIVSLCLVTGRAVIIRPTSRSVETFQFE